jgi:hypothetical protein
MAAWVHARLPRNVRSTGMNDHEHSANRDQAISFRVRAQLLLATKTFNDLAGRYASRFENVGAWGI